MKSFINKHQKFKSICRVMNNYPQAFENKAKALAMKDEFNQESESLTELISKLLRPVSTIHRPKQDMQQKFVASLQEFIGMGFLLATHLDNMPMLDILKVYKKRSTHASAFKLYEMAVHITEELKKYSELAIEFGLDADKLAAFETLVSDFGETLDVTGALLSDRKSGRNDLYSKINSCSKIVRMQLDPFIIFNEKEFPELYKDYMLVRGSRKRRKYIAKDEALAEISGTVTNSATGLPLPDATINLLEFESAYKTDEDGFYLLEELTAGTYTITCHATGFDVPQQVLVTAAAAESLIVDFSLVPVEQMN